MMETEKIVIDTNVLLNGLFVPNSKSHRVLEKVQAGEYAGYLAEISFHEAITALERAYRNTGVNLLPVFEEIVPQLNLNVVGRLDDTQWQSFEKIKGNGDKEIAATTQKISANLCTNDIGDFNLASEYDLTVITPEEFVHDGSLTRQDILRGFFITPHSGSIYIEVSPGGWHETTFPKDNQSKFYVLDGEGIGSLYFLPVSKNIVFEIASGPILSLNYGNANIQHVKIVVAYDKNLGAILCMNDRHVVSKEKWNPCQRTSGMLSIGHSRFIKHHINGGIGKTFGIPTKLNVKGANKIISGKTVHEPTERLSLEDVIKFYYVNGE